MSDIILDYDPFEHLPAKKGQKKLKIEIITIEEAEKRREERQKKQQQLIDKQNRMHKAIKNKS